MLEQIEAKIAFEKLQQEQNCALIDVRTDVEWSFVGYPSLSSINKEPIFLSWKKFPHMQLNVNFINTLDEILQKQFGDNKHDAHLIFICRSGARSFEAASFAEQAGYKNCFNLTSGFEGNLDENGQRGNRDGWKANNLPWKQS